MPMDEIINIQNFLPATITSRKAMEVLLDNLDFSDRKSYFFDFDKIDFISRAFADELIHFVEKTNITAKFIHTNTNVSEMLNAVKSNRNKRNNSFHKIAITPYLKKEELHSFLSLI